MQHMQPQENLSICAKFKQKLACLKSCFSCLSISEREEREEREEDIPYVQLSGIETHTKPQLMPLFHGTGATQGRRKIMQDDYFPHSKETPWLNTTTRFYGVYDGHGPIGHYCAEYAAQTLHKHIQKNLSPDPDIKALIYNAVKTVDHEWCDHLKRIKSSGGTTAVFAFFDKNDLYIANTGDSRAVVGEGKRAIRVSCDHTAQNPKERSRIEATTCDKNGKTIRGWVKQNKPYVWFMLTRYVSNTDYTIEATLHPDIRLFDRLEPSRVIGDPEFKPFAIADPYITYYPLSNDSSFLILATDGLWDVMTDQAAVDFVWAKIEHHQEKIKTSLIKPTHEEFANILARELVVASIDLQEMSRQDPRVSSIHDNVTVTIILLKKIF